LSNVAKANGQGPSTDCARCHARAAFGVGIALSEPTGEPIVEYGAQIDKSSFTQAYSAGEIICIDTNRSVSNSDMIASHAYAIVGYDRKSGLVSLYDPRGRVIKKTWDQLTPDMEHVAVTDTRQDQ